MSNEMSFLIAILGILVSLVTLAAYFNGKLKDAEQMGALKNRVEQLEKDNCKTETTKDKLDALILAVGQLTEKVAGLEKRFDDREVRERSDGK